MKKISGLIILFMLSSIAAFCQSHKLDHHLYKLTKQQKNATRQKAKKSDEISAYFTKKQFNVPTDIDDPTVNYL